MGKKADVKRKRNSEQQRSVHKGDQAQSPTPVSISSRRRWIFRIVVLFLPLLALLVVELVLRAIGYGYPTEFFLKENDAGRVMLADNPRFGWRFFPPSMARTPRPLHLPAQKAPDTVRIFVFGESAAFGDPAPAFGLPRILEVLLRNRYPNVQFEVVNAAMTAINSNVILPIARDCARADGDVWVIYMGNNEVVGPYGGGTVFGPQAPSLPFIRASIAANSSRTGQLLANFRRGLSGYTNIDPANISLALFLDNKLRHNDPRMEKVYAHFARNLEDIVEAGVESGAKVVVSTMASNLKDCAPFASLHRPDLSEASKAKWDHLYQAGVNADQAGKLSEALQAYSEAAAIDDHRADLQFRWARALRLSGDLEASRRHFVLARDYDTLRFRADSRINEIIRQTCSNRLSEGIVFVDGNEVLAQRSPQGVPGDELLYEHVHLNFTGNYWLARAIAGEVTGVAKAAALIGQTAAAGDWLSEEQCAAQLGLNDWDRYQVLEILRQRLEGPPHTLQINHAAKFERLRQEIDRYRTLLRNETLGPSVQRCEQALTLTPRDWVLHQKLAQLLQQAAEASHHERAIKEWQEVIALLPGYPDARYELALLLERTGKAGQAEMQLRQVLRLKENLDPNALNALGRVLVLQGRGTEAVVSFREAIRQKPGLAEAWVNLGSALNRLGNKAEARICLDEAMRLAPRDPQAAVLMGRLLDEDGTLTANLDRFSEMVRTNPGSAGAHFNLAQCLGLLGRSAEARKHYAEALRIQPDFVDAHGLMGLELAKAGNLAEATEHLREAVRLDPATAVARRNLGVALARQQQFEEAAKQFEEALRLNPNDADARKYLQAARDAQRGTVQ